jgi:hypothetical protein
MRSLGIGLTIATVAVLGVAPYASAQRGGRGGDSPAIQAALAKPTPKTADGHPDLTGVWGGPGGNDYTEVKPDGSRQLSLHSGTALPASEDPRNEHVFLFGEPGEEEFSKLAPNELPAGSPPYKPEFIAKVKAGHYDGNFGAGGPPEGTITDPGFYCNNPGVPRLGAPMHIYESKNMVVFLYAPLSGNTFKEIPIDGRPHDKFNLDSTMGDSIGHWEGDTLVVDSVQFSPDTWISAGGIHTNQLHVVERISRQGDVLLYGPTTVEDPGVLTKPWVTPMRKIAINPKNNDGPIVESPKCEEREAVHMQGPVPAKK